MSTFLLLIDIQSIFLLFSILYFSQHKVLFTILLHPVFANVLFRGDFIVIPSGACYNGWVFAWH